MSTNQTAETETKKADRRPRPVRAQQKLLTLTQAEDLSGVPYTTLRDLVIRGELPGLRLGDVRRIWIRRADLDRLIGA